MNSCRAKGNPRYDPKRCPECPTFSYIYQRKSVFYVGKYFLGSAHNLKIFGTSPL